MRYSEKVLEYKDSFENLSQAVKSVDLLFDSKYYPNSKGNSTFKPPFLPGQIYSFSYKTTSKLSDERKFINRNPVVLCTDSFDNKDGLILKGIDLITVPPNFRLEILKRIYDQFINELTSGRTPLPLNDKNLSSFLSGTGYQQSVFGFKTSFFGDVYTVSIEDWPKLPYLSKSFIEGMNLQGIYTEYKSKLI
jgi:hypothetical protein